MIWEWRQMFLPGATISGYVDYLCPQMYVSLQNQALPYADTLDAWRALVKNTNTKLYVGLGGL